MLSDLYFIFIGELIEKLFSFIFFLTISDTREDLIKWIKEVGIRNKVIVFITRSNTETGKRGRIT